MSIPAARTSAGTDPESGITLFMVDGKDSGIKRKLLHTIAGDKQFEVNFKQVKVPKKNILGDVDRGWPSLKSVLKKAAMAKCAEMVGGGQQILDMTIAYAKEREQFGQLIGSFQAIQHHCANMLIDLEGCRWITYKTAWIIDEGMPHEKEVSVTKAWCSQAYRRIVALGHQVFGGIAYMEEHDLPLYFRRARAAEAAFGDAAFHRKIVADHICSNE